MIARVLIVDSDRRRANQYVSWIAERMPDIQCMIDGGPENFSDENLSQRADLIVVDLGSEALWDCTACREWKLQPENRHIPLLVVTDTDPSEEEDAHSWIYMADAYIQRHFTADQFINLLRTVLYIGRNRFEMLNREAMLEEELRRRISEIRKAEEQCRILFEHAPDAIFVEDMDGYVLDVNPAACQLHNMERNELLGKHVTELVPPEIRASVRERFPQWNTHVLRSYESFSYTRDGRTVPVEVRGRAITFRETPAILLHVRDITKKRLITDEMQFRIYLQKIVIDMARHLIAPHPERLNQGIEYALRAMGETMEAQMTAAVHLSRDGKTIEETYGWSEAGRRIHDVLGAGDSAEPFAWLWDAIGMSRSVAVQALEDLPPEAEAVRSAAESLGLKSFYIAAMTQGTHLIGVLGVGFNVSPAPASETLSDGLQQTAGLIGKALAQRALLLQMENGT